jgi:hypothetical protein
LGNRIAAAYNKCVAVVILSIDDATLEAAREYAHEQGWSLNELVRRLLANAVTPAPLERLEAVFAMADKLQCKSDGPWTREEIYDRPVFR